MSVIVLLLVVLLPVGCGHVQRTPPCPLLSRRLEHKESSSGKDHARNDMIASNNLNIKWNTTEVRHRGDNEVNRYSDVDSTRAQTNDTPPNPNNQNRELNDWPDDPWIQMKVVVDRAKSIKPGIGLNEASNILRLPQTLDLYNGIVSAGSASYTYRFPLVTTASNEIVSYWYLNLRTTTADGSHNSQSPVFSSFSVFYDAPEGQRFIVDSTTEIDEKSHIPLILDFQNNDTTESNAVREKTLPKEPDVDSAVPRNP